MAHAGTIARAGATPRPTRGSAPDHGRHPVRGYHFTHSDIDAHSRLVYSEMVDDERRDTGAGFWLRANAWFTDCSIEVRKVLTDNGSCFRSHAVRRDALGDIEHRGTRPDRRRTNGKVERFHPTPADEWAYARIYTSTNSAARVPTLASHLHLPPVATPLGGKPPANRAPSTSSR